MKTLVALMVGLLFGLGLILSGMSDPANVLGFLDLAGKWDPSLAFVMGGAVAVGMLVFPFAARQSKSILGDAMRLPTATQIDLRLVFGGLTFGVGWGLVGYCPGPALVSLAQGGIKPVLFSMAMLIGMAAFALLERTKTKVVSLPM